MQKNGLGKHMWSVLSPLLLRYAIAYVVELIIIGIYMFTQMEVDFSSLQTQEEMYEQITVIMDAIMPYTTEIGAVAAVITIPFLLRMIKKDQLFVAKEISKVKYIYASVMSVAFTVGLNNILLLTNIAEYSDAYQESAELLYMPSLGVQLLCLGVIYPVMEELIFRGVVYKRMRANTMAGIAMFSSAIFFGLYHGNSVQFVYGTFSGVMLAYFCEKFSTIKAPILAHVLMNITAVILTELDAFTWMFAVPVRMVVITIACAFVASSMFVMLRKEES